MITLAYRYEMPQILFQLQKICKPVETASVTLTVLSHPEETMIGLLLDGEKRTHDTQSSWHSSVIVYLHWASVFHS